MENDEFATKVLKALVFYAEGGTISDALQKAGVTTPEFYQFKRKSIEIDNLYREIQKDRADMMIDVVHSIGSGEIENPRVAEVRAKILTKVAGFYDRARFGERTVVEHEVGPDLSAALTAARARVAIPVQSANIAVDPFTGQPLELTSVSQGDLT